MMSDAITKIPSFGFARGTVVRHNGCDRNMIVVRGLDDTTACIVVEGDSAGALRLREYPTTDLTLMRVEVEEDDGRELRINELERTFDRIWAADMRGIKRWRDAAPGRELTMPDRADLVVFLLEELEAAKASRPMGGESASPPIIHIEAVE